MSPRQLAHLRLRAQCLLPPFPGPPAALVARLGALQAQDYAGALWSVGARSGTATAADIETAIARREVVRTWPLRGTLHLVAAADVHPFLAVLASRQIAASARRRAELGLDDRTLARCRRVVTRALAGGQELTREQLYARLHREGIATEGQRGYQIIWRLALEALVCGGPRSGRQPTFVLLPHWVPPPSSVDREATLADLAWRYFTSHGPATVRDFAGWTGLAMADARSALAAVQARLVPVTLDGQVGWAGPEATVAKDAVPPAYLLSGFDELLLGYKDRSPTLDSRHAARVFPGKNGLFLPTLLLDGRVAGTWKRGSARGAEVVTISPFRRLSAPDRGAVTAAVERYARFLGGPVTWRTA